jgi:excisionase family DNA binding protein
MEQKKYYTTGEVAELLGISRATVSRKFEQGILKGKKNPITGDRRVSFESLRTFMREFNLSTISLTTDIRTVLVISEDEELIDTVYTLLGSDDRYEVVNVSRGAEALVTCTKEPVAYLIVDQDLQDISGEDVVETLRRMDVLAGVKILHYAAGVDCQNIRASKNVLVVAKDDKETRQNLLDRLHEMLEIEADAIAPRDSYQHERKSPRRKVGLPAHVWLYESKNPENREGGTATIRDISSGGAYLTDITFDNGFPVFENFRIHISTDVEPLEDWEAKLKVLRLQADGTISAGVQFIDISKENRKKIMTLMS